jgi:predicted DNA-binding protein (MmcQ/YjbR family)
MGRGPAEGTEHGNRIGRLAVPADSRKASAMVMPTRAAKRACRPVVTIFGVRPAVLRDHCLAFPGSSETFPFGPETSVFKVAGKIFALSALAQVPLRVSLKCEPALVEQLREAHPAVTPGYHLNKRHWNTVIIDGSMPARMIKDMVKIPTT